MVREEKKNAVACSVSPLCNTLFTFSRKLNFNSRGGSKNVKWQFLCQIVRRSELTLILLRQETEQVHDKISIVAELCELTVYSLLLSACQLDSRQPSRGEGDFLSNKGMSMSDK